MQALIAAPLVAAGVAVFAVRRRFVLATVEGYSMTPTLRPGDPVPEQVPSANGRVPPGRMAILGDNPGASRDSRDYGLVAQDRLVGVVVRALGPRS